jgi:hypothetical protein
MQSMHSDTTPDNDNADPFATVASALDWLYQLRREMLKQDRPSMSLAERRDRREALEKFTEAETLLLAEL